MYRYWNTVKAGELISTPQCDISSDLLTADTETPVTRQMFY
jgi:hypothetical protein